MSSEIHKTLLKLSQIAKTAAQSAGIHIQSQFHQHYTKEQKQGGDTLASQVVTEVDIKAQEIILEHLNPTINAYDLGLLTEEATDDQSRLEKDYFWCIDPMDGTLPFTEQRSGYAVSIALVSKEGKTVIGVVYVPDLKDCYVAIRGMGVKLNDEPFNRLQASNGNELHLYMDSSFLTQPYYQTSLDALMGYCAKRALKLECHFEFGGVRNAIGVMQSGTGCYFKFPKKQKGCGSIWDYAATSLFLEELDLSVSRADGKRLHLNNPNTTFLNEGGILFATNVELKEFIVNLGISINA